jgi:hypothetical protein
MSKFSTIEELYPKDYMNFYESESESESESEPEPGPEPEPRQVEDKQKKKKVRFADQQMERYTEPVKPMPVTLKERAFNIVRGNLINLVIIIIGFILMSNEYTTNLIATYLTTNPIASLAVRSLGLGLMFVVMRTFMTIIFSRTS